jgi:hypothetical protein
MTDVRLAARATRNDPVSPPTTDRDGSSAGSGSGSGVTHSLNRPRGASVDIEREPGFRDLEGF